MLYLTLKGHQNDHLYQPTSSDVCKQDLVECISRYRFLRSVGTTISPIESQTASVDRLSFETRLHIVRSLPHLSSLQSIIHPFPSSSSSGSILNTASPGDIHSNILFGTVPIPSLLEAPHTSDSHVLRVQQFPHHYKTIP